MSLFKYSGGLHIYQTSISWVQRFSFYSMLVSTSIGLDWLHVLSSYTKKWDPDIHPIIQRIIYLSILNRCRGSSQVLLTMSYPILGIMDDLCALYHRGRLLVFKIKMPSWSVSHSVRNVDRISLLGWKPWQVTTWYSTGFHKFWILRHPENPTAGNCSRLANSINFQLGRTFKSLSIQGKQFQIVDTVFLLYTL